MAQRRNRPLFRIDLAKPRDIDPEGLDIEGVYLYKRGRLAEMARQNPERREGEATVCENLVTEETQSFACRLMPLSLARVAEKAFSEGLAGHLSFASVSQVSPVYGRSVPPPAPPMAMSFWTAR